MANFVCHVLLNNICIFKIHSFFDKIHIIAPVAQRIEQCPSKAKVAGSIPAGCANKFIHHGRVVER